MKTNYNTKKAVYIILLIVLRFNTFAQTNVNGNISEPTTWTKTNSPYIVTDDINVLSELTIEAGVTVKFDGYYQLKITSIGLLKINGLEDDTVYIKSNLADSTKNSWRKIIFDQNTGTSKISYTHIESADTGICINMSKVNISNSKVLHCNCGIYIEELEALVTIESCIIEKCNNGIVGFAAGLEKQIEIKKTTIRDNVKGLQNIDGSFKINDCFVYNNSEYGIYSAGCNITNTTIENNGIGIIAELLDNLISDNIITHNNIGVKLGYFPTQTIINCCSIYDNHEYNLFYVGGDEDGEVDAKNNYFGTDNIDSINSKIFDIYDNPSLSGWFGIDPYLTFSPDDLKIIEQSGDTSINENDTLMLFVVSNEQDVEFQWKNSANNLIDSDNITGSNNDTLIIYNFNSFYSGNYRCSLSTNCNTVYSEIIKVDIATAISNHDLINQIKIYPNPVKEYLFIELDNTFYDIEIFDVLGQSVYKKNQIHGKLCLERDVFTKSGMYILKIVNNGNQIISLNKFIIE